MCKYVATTDLRIGDVFFKKKDPITVEMKDCDIAFLTEHGMIRKQDESETEAAEKTDLEKTEPEQTEPDKKGRKQKPKKESPIEPASSSSQTQRAK